MAVYRLTDARSWRSSSSTSSSHSIVSAIGELTTPRTASCEPLRQRHAHPRQQRRGERLVTAAGQLDDALELKVPAAVDAGRRGLRIERW